MIHQFSLCIHLKRSKPGLGNLGNGIIKSVPFSKLIVIVFGLVPFIQVQIVFREEMIMILGAYQFILISVLALVGVEKGGFVLSEFIVVIFVVEVLVGLVGALVDGGAEVVHYLLEPRLTGLLHYGLVDHR